jgi:hypothetical protein
LPPPLAALDAEVKALLAPRHKMNAIALVRKRKSLDLAVCRVRPALADYARVVGKLTGGVMTHRACKVSFIDHHCSFKMSFTTSFNWLPVTLSRQCCVP